MIRVTLLSTDMNPTSGWGSVTHGLCEAFTYREDIAFRVLLPKTAPRSGNLPYARNVRHMLPAWVASFQSHPHKLLPFFLPGIEIEDTDIIHTIVEFPYAILAWRLAHKARVPFIIMAHGTYGVVPFFRWPDRILYRQAFRNAATIYAPSCFTAEAIRQHSGIQRQISVIHNAVNCDRFQRPQDLHAVREKFGLPPEARVVLGVGAIKRRKGFDVLLRAFARVVKDEPRSHLVIAGDGDASPLVDLATSLGIRGRVDFLGRAMEEDLVGLYQLCEVYAHLPRNEGWHFEGFGIVYLEAGACGKPVVATRSGGVPDAVLDGETGILVDEEDDEAAATAIVRLLQDRELARSMGEAGRKYASQHTWSWYADQIVNLYRAALY